MDLFVNYSDTAHSITVDDDLDSTLQNAVSKAIKLNTHMFKVIKPHPVLVSGDTMTIEQSSYSKLIEQGIEVSIDTLIECKDPDTLKLLLDTGLDVNVRGMFDQTALEYASDCGHVDIVEVLLNSYAKLGINSQNERGWTSLIQAAGHDYTEIVKLLAQQGANINMQTKNGWTALKIASNNINNIETVELLLNYGANPNIQDSESWTALHNSVNNNDPRITRLLLEHGADQFIRNNNKHTPLVIAAMAKNKDIVTILLDNQDIQIKKLRGE